MTFAALPDHLFPLVFNSLYVVRWFTLPHRCVLRALRSAHQRFNPNANVCAVAVAHAVSQMLVFGFSNFSVPNTPAYAENMDSLAQTSTFFVWSSCSSPKLQNSNYETKWLSPTKTFAKRQAPAMLSAASGTAPADQLVTSRRNRSALP